MTLAVSFATTTAVRLAHMANELESIIREGTCLDTYVGTYLVPFQPTYASQARTQRCHSPWPLCPQKRRLTSLEAPYSNKARLRSGNAPQRRTQS